MANRFLERALLFTMAAHLAAMISMALFLLPGVPGGTPADALQRAAYVAALRDEYRQDIDLLKLASELVVEAVVPGERLREELARRFRFYAEGYAPPQGRKRGVLPV